MSQNGSYQKQKLIMKAHLCSISAQDRDLKENMGDSAWQQELCRRTGSHSGICSENRHVDCQLCELGKVWCPYEPWVGWDNWRVVGVWGIGWVGWHSLQLRDSVLATGAGSATSEEKGLPWQPLLSSDHLDSCNVWLSPLFLQVSKVELGWRAQSQLHALVLLGN